MIDSRLAGCACCLRAADAQFAPVAGRQGHAAAVLHAGVVGRNRETDRAVVLGQIRRVDAGRRRGLGQAVGFDQCGVGLLSALGHGALHGHTAPQGHLQRSVPCKGCSIRARWTRNQRNHVWAAPQRLDDISCVGLRVLLDHRLGQRESALFRQLRLRRHMLPSSRLALLLRHPV